MKTAARIERDRKIEAGEIIVFTHLGTERTLAKHADVQRDLKSKAITAADAALKPWYLRVKIGEERHVFKLPVADRDAIRGAKDKLNSIGTDDFKAFIKAKDASKSITCGTLWADWKKAGLPFSKTKFRTAAAAAALTETIERAVLPWWTDKAVEIINASIIEDYAVHRAPALTSADRELAALSSMLQWATLTGRIEKNPVRVRARFAVVKQHCHEAGPENDETLHRIISHLFEFKPATTRHPQGVRNNKLAGGTLAFCALVGLREGEPKFLLSLPPLAETPASTKHLLPGTIFPTRDGKLRMKVVRLKRGQNPFVTLHPAAERFLSAWRAWLAAHKILDNKDTLAAWRTHHAKSRPGKIAAPRTDDRPLFPLGTDDQTILNRALNSTTDALELPKMVPHGFGRAFYVKVRRSDGLEDSAIGSELGQSSDEELIRNTYGDPDDLVGSGMFDWLPEDSAPAWDLLAQDKPLAQPALVLA